jgi:methionyl-tRNA synthetase
MAFRYYLTTPIYYVNDEPHLGHAYTTVAADALARYMRLRGGDVFFLTGTDEHGQKVERAARERGERPIELADRMVDRFQALWKRLGISNDDFIRTTEDRHKRAVQLFFQKIQEKGDIYKGTYEGWYCTPCETFIPETQMEEGNICPDCGRPTERLKEESYFFRMSKYQKALLDHIEKHPDFIQPVTRRNEIVSFVERGLKDLSISRTSFSWGIPVPGDPKHVMYVWVDALANYITAAGYGADAERFVRYWPANLHLIGKDILRFHAVYWPTLLMAANLPVPERVFGHGWWTVEGRKMSKSVRNVVEPNRLMDEFGVDAFRYFLLREVPFGLDGDFSRSALIGRINGDLANDLGNLFSRVLAMVERYEKSMVAGPKADAPLALQAEEMTQQVRGLMEGLAFHRALGRIWDFIGEMNRYVDEKAPWILARDEDKRGELQGVLFDLVEGLRIVALHLAAFMPGTARVMWSQLGLSGSPEQCVGEDLLRWGVEPAVREIRRGDSLFPRIEKEVAPVGAGENQRAGEEGAGSAESGSGKGREKISIEEFGRLELRVALVLSAESIKGSKKLIKLEVDLGEERRTLLAGIAQTHRPEDLLGKKVIVVANLQPAKLMGIESQGMVLAAVADEKNIVLVVPEKDIPPGTRVK